MTFTIITPIPIKMPEKINRIENEWFKKSIENKIVKKGDVVVIASALAGPNVF